MSADWSSGFAPALLSSGAEAILPRMASDSPPDPLAVLAASVRRLIAATVSVAGDAALLGAAASRVDAVTAALAAAVPDPPPERYPGGGDTPSDWMPYDCVTGRWNPIAPPLVITWQEPRAVADVTFTRPYEGPPGCVHGAVIAAAFDQVLNVANLMQGAAGPTARLELRFRAATPLHHPLRFEGWMERREERKVHSRGHLLVDGAVTVEAEGLFIQVDPDRIVRLLDR